MPSRLRFHKDVEKTLEWLARRDMKSYRIVKRKLEEFAETGRGDATQIIPGLYRLRGGWWRAYFGREGEDILVTDLVLRPKAYRHDAVERALRRLGLMMTKGAP